ncbi:predicted protein [Chaetomium globosum CBS 148.51]|uniref:Uncharacterized protein n=1 Tax=Chaetomium globosum (strain ATCC 6205 / CBS 148.51 / DSM 1962 / NBRC 6347 / NRRL 1970) TaxID=306901 RepID=Q2H1N8_CHAGB|nr:uncharacterized protein CHGG_04308 [Chaetomium globosum CBS 148.51]EAQ87689.1 predicted protein [Chaetomium globosum CBS 148.51]
MYYQEDLHSKRGPRSFTEPGVGNAAVCSTPVSTQRTPTPRKGVEVRNQRAHHPIHPILTRLTRTFGPFGSLKGDGAVADDEGGRVGAEVDVQREGEGGGEGGGR